MLSLLQQKFLKVFKVTHRKRQLCRTPKVVIKINASQHKSQTNTTRTINNFQKCPHQKILEILYSKQSFSFETVKIAKVMSSHF